jgi:hypothetical protein
MNKNLKRVLGQTLLVSNISGTVRVIDCNNFTGEGYGSSYLNGRVHSSTTTSMVENLYWQLEKVIAKKHGSFIICAND